MKICTFGDIEDHIRSLDSDGQHKIFDAAYKVFNNDDRSLFNAFREAINYLYGGLETIEVLSSSNVRLLEYSTNTRDLYVVFSNDARYVYHNVPQEVWDNRNNDGSVGKWVNTEIKPFFDVDRVS